MPNVYFIGLFAVLIVSGIAGSYLKGRSDGTDIVTAKYATRDVKAAQDYAAKTQEITEQYRAKEAKFSEQVAAVSKDYQRRLAANETAKRAALAAATILRDPGTIGQACGDSAPKTSASTSGHNGAAGAELSKEATGFLLSLASEADAVVLQLTACQNVLASERQ